MLITILLATVASVGAIEDLGFRPLFHHRDCEQCLLDNSKFLGRQLVPVLGEMPTALRVERAPVSREPAEDFEREYPHFIWFIAQPGETAAHVNRRATAAAARETGRRREVEPDFDASAALSPLELRALGLPPEANLRPREINGWLIRRARGWSVDLWVRGKPVGSINLKKAGVRSGYTNLVYEWQWRQITRAIDRGDRPGPVTPTNFLMENSHTVFTRADGDRRFGYFVREHRAPSGRSIIQLEVAWLRTSGRAATSADDIVFPRRGDESELGDPPPVNLGVTDLGLRLTFARGSISGG